VLHFTWSLHFFFVGARMPVIGNKTHTEN
jgi:hypothetical protein